MRGRRAGPVETQAAKGDPQEEILSAAARAFMVNGYAATSVDTVADLLGCTKGRIYYQFKGKAQLFFEVHRKAMQMNLEVVKPIAQGPGSAQQRLRRMVECQLVTIMEHLPFQRVLVLGVEMHLEGRTTAQERESLALLIGERDEYEKLFAGVVAQGVHDKTFRAVDPRIFTKVLLGAMTWMTMWYRPLPGETDVRRSRLAHELADYMLGGLQPAPPGSSAAVRGARSPAPA